MTVSLRKNIISLVVTISYLVMTSVVGFAQTKKSQSPIKTITSKENAEKTFEDEAKSESSLPRVTGGLKVHSIGVGLGQTFLNSDLNDNGDDAITADLFYNYSASHSFDFLANFHASKHKLGPNRAELLGASMSIKAKVFHFDSFSPFVLAGLGFYAPKVKRLVGNTLKNSKTKLTFGTNFGAGAELRLNAHFTVGLMATFHNPFDVKQELDPEVEGSYYKLLITTFYSF